MYQSIVLCNAKYPSVRRPFLTNARVMRSGGGRQRQQRSQRLIDVVHRAVDQKQMGQV